jgi:hypothetical protein
MFRRLKAALPCVLHCWSHSGSNGAEPSSDRPFWSKNQTKIFGIKLIIISGNQFAYLRKDWKPSWNPFHHLRTLFENLTFLDFLRWTCAKNYWKWLVVLLPWFLVKWVKNRNSGLFSGKPSDFWVFPVKYYYYPNLMNFPKSQKISKLTSLHKG